MAALDPMNPTKEQREEREGPYHPSIFGSTNMMSISMLLTTFHIPMHYESSHTHQHLASK
jgi:hypothetical protein